MSTYYTDRECGARAPSIDTIDERLWAGLRVMIQTRIGDASFGFLFPEHCPDGTFSCGCNETAFRQVLEATVPRIKWPLSPTEVPDTPDILDLLVFCAKAVGEPIQGRYHQHFRHHHLNWDREVGLNRFVADVNTLFLRNALAFELTPEGQARRLLPAPLAGVIGGTLFQTGEAETDRLLETARQLILSPRLEDRSNALEKLWDAFERLKTLEPGSNKRERADALLDQVAASGSNFRGDVLASEAKALTDIGNKFSIRHSEVTQEALTTQDQIDYLFTRMFAFVRLVLKGTGRGG